MPLVALDAALNTQCCTLPQQHFIAPAILLQHKQHKLAAGRLLSVMTRMVKTSKLWGTGCADHPIQD